MDKNLQKRIIFGGVALLLFLPFLLLGELSFQMLVSLLALQAAHEMLRMKRLRISTFEGILTLFATFIITLPWDKYFPFLSHGGDLFVYYLVVFILLGATIVTENYSFEDAAYPISTSLYVGIGFNALIDARVAGLDKAVLALLIVWVTDICAYFFGNQFGRTKLLPHVSPNKTVEGSLCGILGSVITMAIFVFCSPKVRVPYGFLTMIFLAAIFSIVSQLGDLVESAIKRHFGVKDSGKFIAGHGGVLDRFDSILFVFPIMQLLGLF